MSNGQSGGAPSPKSGTAAAAAEGAAKPPGVVAEVVVTGDGPDREALAARARRLRHDRVRYCVQIIGQTGEFVESLAPVLSEQVTAELRQHNCVRSPIPLPFIY